ncbi:MAG: carbon-nitrogen hydrolase family protein [Clostridia bacterium]
MMRVGIAQMPVCADKKKNIATAREYISHLSDADIVVLPEMFCCPYSNACFEEYAEPKGGFIWRSMAEFAREFGVYLVAGSMPERDNGKIYNTSYIFSPLGEQIARHRKVHLFDIDVKHAQHFCESETLTGGDDITVFKTPFGNIGVCICFDIRFPELSRAMAMHGADIIIIPAAFNMTTGPAHWELTLRARAVDNQVFTVAAAPARDTSSDYVSFAHSMVCSPWGDVVSDAGHGPCEMLVDLELNMVNEVRLQLPLLSARRTDVYIK